LCPDSLRFNISVVAAIFQKEKNASEDSETFFFDLFGSVKIPRKEPFADCFLPAIRM